MRNRYLYYITLMTVLGLTPEWIAAQEKTQYAPRLVVNINIDQLRTDYMEAFSPLYSTNGFKMLMQQGMVFTNARYPFTPVDRASAISSVVTGVTPYYHGIVGQRWLDRETLRPVYCVVNDPSQLQTSTIADELKVATEGNSLCRCSLPRRCHSGGRPCSQRSLLDRRRIRTMGDFTVLLKPRPCMVTIIQ